MEVVLALRATADMVAYVLLALEDHTFKKVLSSPLRCLWSPAASPITSP